jgi:hypothetical protein
MATNPFQDIRARWTLNGALPGEAPQPVELGIGAPAQGLYLREDVELRSSVLLSSFVKKTLKKSHITLIERVKAQAERVATANSASDSSVEQLIRRMSMLQDVKASPSPPAYQAQLAYSPPYDKKTTYHSQPSVPTQQFTPPTPQRFSAPPNIEAYASPPTPGSWSMYSPQSPHPQVLRPGYGQAQSQPHVRQRSAYAVPKLRIQTPVTPPKSFPVYSHIPAQQPNLYPAPLRLRHSSTASVVTAASLLSTELQPRQPSYAEHVAERAQQQEQMQRQWRQTLPPPQQYRQPRARSQPEMPSPAQAMPTTQGTPRALTPPTRKPSLYSYQHPEYPQMNPYANELADDGDDVWQAFFAADKGRKNEKIKPTDTVPVGQGALVTAYTIPAYEKSSMVAATLSGPFVPELE